MCTSRLRTRGVDVQQQAKGEEGQIRNCRIKRRGTEMHLQAMNKRDGCAPTGQRRRGTDAPAG
jgi:hypothetical protein